MKKIALLSLLCFFGLHKMYAQNSKMTSEELKYRSSIEQFLKEEGYVPTIDDDDNSLNFKKEGNRYWLTVKGDAPYYIELHRSGFDMEGANRKLVLEACNDANMNKRCGKACVDDDTVVFTVEFFSYSIEGFKQTFYDNMRAVNNVREAVGDYYNEHNK